MASSPLLGRHPDTPSASSAHQRRPPPPPLPLQTPQDLDSHDYRSQYHNLSSHSHTNTTSSPVLTSPPPGPVRRKPLSSTASPLAIRYSDESPVSTTYVELPKPDHRFARAGSVDSPTLYEDPLFYMQAAAYPSFSRDDKLASTEAPASTSQYIPDPRTADSQPELSDSSSEYDDRLSDLTPGHREEITPGPYAQGGSDQEPKDPFSTLVSTAPDPDNTDSRPSTPQSMFAPKPTPPHLNLDKVDPSFGRRDSISQTAAEKSQLSKFNKPLPKSPAQPSPFAALFGWGSQTPSLTEVSPLPSPASPTRSSLPNDIAHGAASNSQLEQGANTHVAAANFLGYCETYLSTPPPPNASSVVQVDEMEDELKAISSELAASIRREMDLEELVDKLQDQVNNPQAPGRRTSDYFSDSGYSSSKVSEYDQSREEIEKIQRKSEQEKASIRLELTNKLQDERSRRKVLDIQIKDLAEKASKIDLAQMNNLDANGRIRDLENTCEDLRRKLSAERSSKTNFEDLLGALKGQLQDACLERDNLRDEVVPQLRARVEGLETEAAEYSNLTYESTKMQQELQTLKQENSELKTGSAPSSFGMGALRSQKSGAGLGRSNSVKTGESREAIAERLKDVEAQRDALHIALKNLLDRQEFQNRENAKKIQVLEAERQRLLSDSPKKAGFEKEISTLRTEINTLRRRAEDALEQKWQVEKGLSGLKMDLDRADEEIASLRAILKGQDILLPPSTSGSSSDVTGVPATSASLKKAYKDLQEAYRDSLERIKKLEHGIGPDTPEKTRLAIQRLEQSLSTAELERDAARQHATVLLSQVNGLTSNEAKNLSAERALADELHDSAAQIEKLASQVQQQLATNAALRRRLSETVARGDEDRRSNSERITGLMERLRSLEEQLVAAQSASEERIARHEDEVSSIREAHNEQLQRMNSSSGLNGVRKNTLMDASPSPFHHRSPRLGPAKSFDEAAEMDNLRTRVAELEKALAEAEDEMQEVVGKMSTAQIEVMNLQEERDTAARETLKLQKFLKNELGASFEQRFKSLKGKI